MAEYQYLMNESLKNSKYGLNRGNLKMIALFCMALDHIAAIVLTAWQNTLIKDTPLYIFDNFLIIFLRLIGRLAFPIFCFFIVEGLIHTRNVYKYAFRLLLLALLSEIPFDLAHTAKFIDFNDQNVFWTLFLGLVAIYCIEGLYRKFKLKKPALYLLIFIIALLADLVAYTINCDYGAFGVTTIIIIYLVGKKEYFMPFVINGLALINFYFVLINLKGIDYGENADLAPIAFAVYITFVLTVSSVALFFTKFIKNKNSRKMYAACVTLSAMSFDEAAALVNVLLMKYYNGEKGKKIGWIFYLFYPLHFLILACICKLLGFY